MENTYKARCAKCGSVFENMYPCVYCRECGHKVGRPYRERFSPTNEFRWWVPVGGLNQEPIVRVLQQRFEDMSGRSRWKDVPMVFGEYAQED